MFSKYFSSPAPPFFVFCADTSYSKCATKVTQFKKFSSKLPSTPLFFHVSQFISHFQRVNFLMQRQNKFFLPFFISTSNDIFITQSSILCSNFFVIFVVRSDKMQTQWLLHCSLLIPGYLQIRDFISQE